VKLDLGCGKRKKEGFVGVDTRAFEGVDIVCDLGNERWPWDDGSVDEAHCSHMIEHLTATQRVHFVNELHRVLKVGGQCQLIFPHALSERAYGDVTHQWPPVTTFWLFYLKREWRDVNAPHNDFYACDFDATWGMSVHPALHARNAEFQQFAVSFYKEAIQDIIATLTKRESK